MNKFKSLKTWLLTFKVIKNFRARNVRQGRLSSPRLPTHRVRIPVLAQLLPLFNLLHHKRI